MPRGYKIKLSFVVEIVFYHTSNSRYCMGVIGEALQLHAIYKKPYFLLQVMRESVSGTTSHVRCVWACNEIEGSYDKIIITIVPSYTGKKHHSFVAVGIITRAAHS